MNRGAITFLYANMGCANRKLLANQVLCAGRRRYSYQMRKTNILLTATLSCFLVGGSAASAFLSLFEQTAPPAAPVTPPVTPPATPPATPPVKTDKTTDKASEGTKTPTTKTPAAKTPKPQNPFGARLINNYKNKYVLKFLLEAIAIVTSLLHSVTDLHRQDRVRLQV